MGFGAVVSSPEAFALDFAFTAVFTALAVSLWRGNEDALPWIVALAVSILAAEVLPGKWYIVIGAVSGALTAAIGQPQEVAHAAQ
jgi:predicted branched-subunit amino acid permease